MGLHLKGMHLMGIHLMGMHLIGVRGSHRHVQYLILCIGNTSCSLGGL
jgi:hypothetical protein